MHLQVFLRARRVHAQVFASVTLAQVFARRVYYASVCEQLRLNVDKEQANVLCVSVITIMRKCFEKTMSVY